MLYAVLRCGRLASGFQPKGRSNEEIYLITKVKMQRYQEFKGDLDDWVSSQKNGLDETLTGDEWSQIEKLVQRLKIQRNGNASIDYKNETERLLLKSLGDSEVIQIAKSMAR
jgi:hypothetical protein